MSEAKMSYGLYVPGHVWFDGRISLPARCLYGVILGFCREGRPYCYASNEYLATKFKDVNNKEVHQRSVARWMQELATVKHITVEYSTSRRHRRIFISQPTSAEKKKYPPIDQECQLTSVSGEMQSHLTNFVDDSQSLSGENPDTTKRVLKDNISTPISPQGTKTSASRERKVFKPPTEDEVIEYMTPKCHKDCAIKFWLHFKGNGWKSGNTKIVDWKSKADLWILNEHKRKQAGHFNNGTTNNAMPRKLDPSHPYYDPNQPDALVYY